MDPEALFANIVTFLIMLIVLGAVVGIDISGLVSIAPTIVVAALFLALLVSFFQVLSH